MKKSEIAIFVINIIALIQVKNILILLFLFTSFFSFGQDSGKKVRFTNAGFYEKEFELIHTKLEISFDIPNEVLFGKEWITLRPYNYSTDKLILDAKGMKINDIIFKGKSLNYSYDNKKIKIDLNAFYTRNDTLNLFIDYVASPSEINRYSVEDVSNSKGLYFLNSKGLSASKSAQIWTQGQTESNSCWFPTIDKPNQKTTQEISIRVPSKYVTVSNGTLNNQKTHTNGERTDSWVMNEKHAPYLFFIAVGEFSVFKDSWREKEVSYYVEKEYEHLASAIFGKTPKMMEFFSDITSVDYVWDSYRQIVLRDFVSGAMENTTAVAHSELAYQTEGDLLDGNRWEPTIAHELFHHWFGNLVTAENWSNISLSESFANYGEYLWLEHEYGFDKAEKHRLEGLKLYKDQGDQMENLVRFDYDNPKDVFDLITYNKGGAILHMLKNYIGTASFFEGLRLYLTENAFISTEVPQLRMAFEKASGKDLNWFFNQWYYGSGYPKIRISQDYNVLEKTVTVTLRQQGKEFYFPVSIDVFEKGRKKRIELFVDSREKSITFSYDTYPNWIQVDPDHVLLAEFSENKTLRDYRFILTNASHFVDRKNAVLALSEHQEDKRVFEMIVESFKDANYEVQVAALESVDLSGKYAKAKVISKIENIAKTSKNNYVKAAAIKVMGRLVYFDYQSFFEKSFSHKSNIVKGSALEALYYLDKSSAIERARNLPDNVKETIAYPLSQIYIKEKDEKEIVFVSNYIVQGMYMSNNDEIKALFKKGFYWVAGSNSAKAFVNITSDLVKKGEQFKKYNFDKQAIKMLRIMVEEQDKVGHPNKSELIEIVNSALMKLIKV